MKTLALSIHLGSAALAAGLLLASSPARAQDAVASGVPLATSEPAQRIGPQRIGAFERNRVYHSSEDDGTPWVRGATYKARFGVEGASYAPYLGSDAPRNFPVLFRIASVSVGGAPIAFDAGVAAQRSGDAIRYERGGLTEVYEIAVQSIEQSFVLAALPARGELVLRIATESELARRELPDRIEFGNELGAVRYGRATAIDASGASIAAPTSVTEHGIEIRVPADFVARARLPLTIDPILSTFSIDMNPPNAFTPNCAFDVTNNCWLVVHEEVFSVTDHDVVWRRLGALDGQSLGSGYVDASLSEYWAQPDCANNNALDRFLVVATVGVETTGVKRKIRGRTVSAANGGLSTTVDIAAEQSAFDLFSPSVGGDPLGLPSYFLVAWEKVVSSGDYDIHARLVDPNLALAGPIQNLAASIGTNDRHPNVSKSNGGSAWNIVWERLVSGSPSHDDIYGARIDRAGNTIASSFPIDTTSFDTYSPKASTCLNGTNRWLLVYTTNENNGASPDLDIGLKLLDGTTLLDEANLTEMETIAGNLSTLHEWQSFPDVDSDRDSFAIAYSETKLGSASSTDVYAATVAAVGTQLQLSEGHQLIAGSMNVQKDAAIASAGGSGAPWRLELVVATQRTTYSGPGDIVGGLYDDALYSSFCHPTYDGVPSCPCGNDPSAFGRGCNNSAGTGGAQIVASGTSTVLFDNLVLTMQFAKPNALSIFNQGNAVLGSAVPFGQGLRCVGGSIKRLYTKTASAGGIAIAPVAGDPSVHARSAALGDTIVAGMTRAYYVYYRDPIVLGGCASGSTFNTTQTVQAIWIP